MTVERKWVVLLEVVIGDGAYRTYWVVAGKGIVL